MTVEEQTCWKLLSLIFLSLWKNEDSSGILNRILLAVHLDKKEISGFSCCDADWLEVTVLPVYKGIKATFLNAFINFPRDQRDQVITGFQITDGLLWVMDQLQDGFESQIFDQNFPAYFIWTPYGRSDTLIFPLSGAWECEQTSEQTSGEQTSGISIIWWDLRALQQIVLHFVRYRPVLSSCLGFLVTHKETLLYFVCVLKEGVQDLQERQQWGEIAEAFHGMVDPALAIPEDFPWKSAPWPIMLFWCSTPGLRGRIWTTLLSGKELGLEAGD